MFQFDFSHNKGLKILGFVSAFFCLGLIFQITSIFLHFYNELFRSLAYMGLMWAPIVGFVHAVWSYMVRKSLDRGDKALVVCSILNIFFGVFIIIVIIRLASLTAPPATNFIIPKSE